MPDKKPADDNSNTRLIAILLLGSAVWLILASLWAYSASSADDITLGMKPNEIGDFLAGTFAPLAFIWLAAAVFIQSRELKAQREELQLTREEMRAQRGVLGQQVDVAMQNIRFVKAQTDVLKREQELRDQNETDTLAKSLLDAICTAAQNLDQVKVTQFSDQFGNLHSSRKHDNDLEAKSDIYPAGRSLLGVYTTDICSALAKMSDLLEDFSQNGDVVFTTSGEEQILHLCLMFDQLVNVRNKSSQKLRLELSGFKIDAAKKSANRVHANILNGTFKVTGHTKPEPR